MLSPPVNPAEIRALSTGRDRIDSAAGVVGRFATSMAIDVDATHGDDRGLTTGPPDRALIATGEQDNHAFCDGEIDCKMQGRVVAGRLPAAADDMGLLCRRARKGRGIVV